MRLYSRYSMSDRDDPASYMPKTDERIGPAAKISRWFVRFVLCLCLLGVPTTGHAAFEDLQLTDKVTGNDFAAGKIVIETNDLISLIK